MSAFSRQLFGFAFVTAFAVCGAMPQQFSNADVIGGLADCDSSGLRAENCASVAGQNCQQNLDRCTAANGQSLTVVCNSGGGAAACGAAACIAAIEDTTNANCNVVAP